MPNSSKFNRALLTGGNGNIGRLVADVLLNIGVEVIKFDLPETRPLRTRDGETIVTGDIRNESQISKLISTHKPDIIYHFASLLSGSSENDLFTAWEINATASLQLMKLAIKHNVESFFFASTGATYGPDLEDPLPEGVAQWPQTMYGVTKVAVERLGVYLKVKHGWDFRCLRFPLVISPFAPQTAVTAYPSHAFQAALIGKHFIFPVSPEIGMSSIFLEDVINGIMQFTATERIKVTQHAYNLHAFHFSARAVEEEIRKHVPEFHCDYQPIAEVESLLRRWPNEFHDLNARNDWGWDPQFDFQGSCNRMFELLSG